MKIVMERGRVAITALVAIGSCVVPGRVLATTADPAVPSAAESAAAPSPDPASPPADSPPPPPADAPASPPASVEPSAPVAAPADVSTTASSGAPAPAPSDNPAPSGNPALPADPPAVAPSRTGSISAAAGAEASLAVTITPNATPLASGDKMVWTISWRCASATVPCENAKITMPVPVSDSLAIAGTSPSAQSPVGSGIVAAVTNNVATWTFPASQPAGTSGQVIFTLDSRNYLTPNGATYSPSVTFTASNAPTVIDGPAPITLTSKVDAYISKIRLPLDTAPLPIPGQEVTYRIVANNDPWQASQISNGTMVLQNAVVSDQLPATAQFVRAQMTRQYGEPNLIGTYDCTVSGQDAAGLGGLVTCPTYTDPPRAGVNMTIISLYVTVKYPNVTVADSATNTACIDANGYNQLAATVHECASVTHGFRTSEGGPGFNVQKTNNSDGVTRPGSPYEVWTASAFNTGGATVDYSFTDHWPCALTSPATAACAPSGQRVTRIQVHSSFLNFPQRIEYTLNTGATGSVSLSYPYPTTAAPAGTWFTDMVVSGTLAPRETFALSFQASTPADVPTTVPSGTDYRTNLNDAVGAPAYVENCLSDVSFKTATATSPTNVAWEARHCASKLVENPLPGILMNKTTLAPTGVGIGGQVSFSVSMQNYSATAPLKPVFTDLLPAGLDYVPGSLVADRAPWMAATVVEAIKDYDGTGRTLVRAKWPGLEIPATGGGFAVRFSTVVLPRTDVGAYTNTANYFDATYRNACVGAKVTDTHDLDGDGDRTEDACTGSANYQVLATGGLEASKAVKGEADSAFAGPPAVGHTAENGVGTYQLTLSNAGNVGLTGVVAYDILPYVGDPAIGPGTGTRGSQWTAQYAGNLVLPAGVSVQYSASNNPCRGELTGVGLAMTAGPAGCVNDWSSSAPSNVRALRLVYAGTLDLKQSLAITYDVRAPGDAVGVAWNSVSMAAGARIDKGPAPLPTEAPKVGLQITSDVSLEKSINSTTPAVAGGLVTYQLVVANDGPATARNVTVGDQLPESLTFVSADPAADYDNTTGVWTVGDLADGESKTLSITARVSASATGTIVNDAQVTRNDVADRDSTPDNMNTTPAEDDEDTVSVAVVGDPSLTIVKATNTVDANTATEAPLIAANGDVAWTYLVTNTGQMPLRDVTVTDDQGVTVTCPADDDLAPGESMTCTATGTATATGVYVNIGTASGTPTDFDGNDLVGVTAPSATDPSHYTVSRPLIEVVKTTNGGDGVIVAPDSPVRWTYVVTNTGNVSLSGVSVTDDVEGAVSCPAADLAVGASMTCTVDGTASAGSYENTATASGTGPDTVGTDGAPVTGLTVSDDDPSSYLGAEPAISIVKTVNGEDANEAPGPHVTQGSTMSFVYTVTNEGNVPLADVVVVDDRGVTVTCPSTALAVGASMDCTGSAAAGMIGLYTNIGTVTAHGPDTVGVDGAAVPGVGVTASDPANATVVSPPPTPDVPGSGVLSGGGSLPETGGNPFGMVLIALALLATGAAGIVVTRRRQAIE